MDVRRSGYPVLEEFGVCWSALSLETAQRVSSLAEQSVQTVNTPAWPQLVRAARSLAKALI